MTAEEHYQALVWADNEVRSHLEGKEIQTWK